MGKPSDGFHTFLLRLRSLFRRHQVENELDEEIRQHLECRIEQFVAAGIPPKEARYAALRAMDGLERLKEACREKRKVGIIEDLLHDLRYAGRTLGKSPGFALVAILTLAMGIGANVGIFTVVNAVLLQPLPVIDSERIGVVTAEEVNNHSIVGASWTKFLQLRAQSRTLQNVAAYVQRDFIFSDGVNPEQVGSARVTAEFFGLLGVAPILGRGFLPEDDVENAAPVALVSYGFWQRRMGADPAAVGKTIKLDSRDTVVVGILPLSFKFQFGDREPQIYMPCVFTPGALSAAQIRSGAGFLEYVVRLNPRVSFSQAQTELNAIDDRYKQEFASYADAGRFRMHLVPLVEDLVGNVRSSLLILMGAVSLVLLIACANVAHLQLARAAGRQREIAVRLALGAPRGRLIRQFLTESLLLSLVGCAFGVLLAQAAVRLLVAEGPSNIPRLSESGIHTAVLLFSIGVSCVAAVLFGIAPALRASRTDINGVLKDSRSGGRTGRRGSQLHNLLATSETAVAVALIVAAGLLIQSLVKMQAVNPGFNPRSVITAHITLPRQKYVDSSQRELFFTQLLHNLQAQAGVRTIGATSYLPMSGSNYGFFFFVEGQPNLASRNSVISVRHISADYLRTMSIPLLRGRFFTEKDDRQAAPVAIINETTAQRYFSGQDPVGRHIASTGDGVMREIVGVVSDVKFDGPAKSGREELYLPYLQIPWASMTVVVRSQLPLDQVVALLKREVQRLDPDQPIAEMRSMEEIVAASTAQQHFTSFLLGMFALLAIALAIVGLYGVIAYLVAQRTHEFGIRMALGARQADVARLVLGQGVKLIGGGMLLGLLGAFAGGRILSGLLFGISPASPLPYAIALLLLGLVGMLACYVPARRAVRVDPITVLRYE